MHMHSISHRQSFRIPGDHRSFRAFCICFCNSRDYVYGTNITLSSSIGAEQFFSNTRERARLRPPANTFTKMSIICALKIMQPNEQKTIDKLTIQFSQYERHSEYSTKQPYNKTTEKCA